MKRRHFIQQTSLAAAALLAGDSLLAQAKKTAAPKFGLQLYTTKDVITKDMEGTLKAIADAGYSFVETYGFDNGKMLGKTIPEFAALLKKYKLTTTGGHYGLYGFLNKDDKADLKATIDAAAALGQKYVVVPHLNKANYPDKLSVVKLAKQLNELGKACKLKGLKAGYHNHNFEFEKYGDETMLQILLDETDPALVDFEMDIYWVRFADNDPVEWFNKYKGRFTQWHIKDLKTEPKKESTEVGNGIIDFKALYAQRKVSGLKYAYVEQEAFERPVLESIKISADALKTRVMV